MLRTVGRAIKINHTIANCAGREEDKETVVAVQELLTLINSFPDHFDETSMFVGGQHAQVRR